MATPTIRIVSQFHPRRTPEIGEVARHRSFIAPSKQSESDQSQEAAVFANVNTFCTADPVFRPRVLTQVRTTRIRIARNCWVLTKEESSCRPR